MAAPDGASFIQRLFGRRPSGGRTHEEKTSLSYYISNGREKDR